MHQYSRSSPICETIKTEWHPQKQNLCFKLQAASVLGLLTVAQQQLSVSDNMLYLAIFRKKKGSSFSEDQTALEIHPERHNCQLAEEAPDKPTREGSNETVARCRLQFPLLFPVEINTGQIERGKNAAAAAAAAAADDDDDDDDEEEEEEEEEEEDALVLFTPAEHFLSLQSRP
ncbi:hypothetical protein A6R68_03480, partial [Neotoma lepida]